ncbi:RNA-directed DNA polymerase, eukaryota [Tanacetum coccineum]
MALCLDRHLSDHRPILLCEIPTDYGLTPFRFYHSWFKWYGFDVMVEQAWNSLSHTDYNGLIRFKKKLQDLKKIIRSWVKVKKSQQSGAIKSIKDELTDIDKRLYCGNVSDEMLFKRMELMRQLHDINQMEDAFKDHFATRFKQPVHGRLKLNISFTNRLSTEQGVDMDRSVSRDEIRIAVRNCGENKSPGPDGYSFEFFKRYWRFVGPDFCSAVECFFDNGKFPKGCNSSFIALIPKVRDAKFVTDFRPVDFEHFSSAMASILVNGSPTSEFPFFCGLKQGDPLAPYLFILIMESLYISFSRAINDGLFKGVHIQGSMSLSHIFYADDAVFIGEWSNSNMVNIVKILKCFFLASGLKINIQKSQVLGVGVHRNLVVQAASLIGCAVMQKPFRYLGVMVGDCMSRKLAWADTVQKLRSRLSNWKVKTLSIGGRLTLLKLVLGASPLYNMSIYKVPKGVLKEMEAIRSNFFNGVDTLKKKIGWVWRFLSQHGSLWYRVIQALYGPSFELHPVNQPSIWCSILREMHLLNSKGFDFGSHYKKRVGDGHTTRFWYDNWVSNQPFRVRSVRDGFERQQWTDLNSLSGSVILSSFKDRWICDLNGDGEFRVKEVRIILDDILLPFDTDATRWVKYILIKINVFAWRARLDRLPTRCNLIRRGVVLDSSLCPDTVAWFQRIFIMSCFDVILLSLSFAGFVVGGTWIGMTLLSIRLWLASFSAIGLVLERKYNLEEFFTYLVASWRIEPNYFCSEPSETFCDL